MRWSGVDADFHRGENSYDLLYGDVRLGPNPCLAALAEAPYYGVEIFPGDIGTKGGMLTNADAAVLDREGRVIPGLYAVGNNAGSFYGMVYPPQIEGSGIGHAFTFAYLAAKHLVAQA